MANIEFVYAKVSSLVYISFPSKVFVWQNDALTGFFFKVSYIKQCWDQGLFIHVLESCWYFFLILFVIWKKRKKKILFVLGRVNI